MKQVLLLLFLLVAQKTFSQNYTLPDGEYMDTTTRKDTSCNDGHLYYYQVGGKYLEASSTVLNELKTFFKHSHKRYRGNGYITFRFMIGCNGQRLPKTQVLQTDDMYKSCHFDKHLVDELYRFLNTLHNWKVAKSPEGKLYSYTTFITYKIEDGKWLLLFLSVLAAASFCVAQTRQTTACDCNNHKVRDSLTMHYIDSGAERYWYNNPQWNVYCDSLIQICPNIAVAYQHKAIPFLKNGDYAVAFALEDKAVQYDPVLYTSYRAFLKCIFTKDYTGAIADFEASQKIVLNSYEMDHTFFFYIGLSYLELKHYKLAAINLKKDVFIQTGDDTSQLPHFNTLFYLGVLNYEMKTYPLAEKYLLQCLQKYPQHPDANYYLGLVYENEKNKAFANTYLRLAKKAIEDGYTMNEDNIFYANYPHQVRLYEVNKALEKYR